MDRVQGVAGPGVVDVAAGIVGVEPVVGGVVDAAEAERRALVVALGGVVVDHVQDHLDAGGVQAPHHGLELGHRLVAGRETLVGGEEADGVVAPVVGQAALDQVPLVDVLVHRQQLHGRHAQPLQVLDGRIRCQPAVPAAQLVGHVGMLLGEALDVDLVDDRSLPGGARLPVLTPVEGAVHHHAARRLRRRVPLVRIRRRQALGVHSVADLQRGRVDRAGHAPRVRVEQQLGRVEPMPVRRRPRAGDAVAVVLAGPDVGQVGVPHVVRTLRQGDAPLASVAVEQGQLDARGVLAEEGEVGALPVPGRPQRIRCAAPDAHGQATMRSIASSGSQVQSGRKFAS